MRAVGAILSILLCEAAGAQTLSNLYRERTISFVEALEKQGIKQIACDENGCLSPPQILDALRSTDKKDRINWQELPTFEKIDGATRWSAFFEPKSRTVYLNRSLHTSPEDIDAIGPVGFHEVLGVKGKKDQGFQISMAAAMYLDLKSQSLNRPQNAIRNSIIESYYRMALVDGTFQRPDLEKKEDQVLLSGSGGGVIVGGGGDTRTLSLRLKVLKYMSGTATHAQLLLQRVVPVEIDREDLGIRYVFDKGELSRILVPESVWKTEEVVEDLSWLLKSTLPEEIGVPLRHRQGDLVTDVIVFLPKDLQSLHPVILQRKWVPYLRQLCAEYSCPSEYQP